MTVLVLDSGAVTSLALRDRRSAASLAFAPKGDSWPTVVPSVVLVECLSGRQRTDAVCNRFLKKCLIVDGPHEKPARRAAVLRAQAGRGSAVDAVVVAMAEPGGTVLKRAARTALQFPMASVDTGRRLSVSGASYDPPTGVSPRSTEDS